MNIFGNRIGQALAVAVLLIVAVLAYNYDDLREMVDARTSPASTSDARQPAATGEKPVARIRRQSLAVLPFVNMSDKVEQETFSDAVTVDLMEKLSKIEGLELAKRTASFSFKGSGTGIEAIGEALGVDYLLEGSVRKSYRNRLRITAQLIDLRTGFHLWSDTYSRNFDDLEAIEKDIADNVAAALEDQF